MHIFQPFEENTLVKYSFLVLKCDAAQSFWLFTDKKHPLVMRYTAVGLNLQERFSAKALDCSGS